MRIYFDWVIDQLGGKIWRGVYSLDSKNAFIYEVSSLAGLRFITTPLRALCDALVLGPECRFTNQQCHSLSKRQREFERITSSVNHSNESFLGSTESVTVRTKSVVRDVKVWAPPQLLLVGCGGVSRTGVMILCIICVGEFLVETWL